MHANVGETFCDLAHEKLIVTMGARSSLGLAKPLKKTLRYAKRG